jgi:hypothetical protein
MKILSLTQIYWYASIGAVIGFIFGVVIKKEGVSLEANLFWGVVGAILMGAIGFNRGLGDGVLFSFMATWVFLFLINVFHQHHTEDLFGEIDHPAHLSKRAKK